MKKDVNNFLSSYKGHRTVTLKWFLSSTCSQITAINDPAIEVEYILYLIKYDSTHGRLSGNISHIEDEIKIDGKIYLGLLECHLLYVVYILNSSSFILYLIINTRQSHIHYHNISRKTSAAEHIITR